MPETTTSRSVTTPKRSFASANGGARSTTKPRTRTWRAALALQLGIRARYALESWFFTKVFLKKDLSAYPSPLRPASAPKLDGYSMLALKLLWTASGTLRIIKPIGFGLAFPTGIWHTLGFLHRRTYRRVSRVMQGSPAYLRTNRETAIPEYDWRRGSSEEFHRQFVARPHPVVLRGFMENSRLVREMSFDKLMERYGNQDVLLTKKELDGYPGKLRDVMDPSVYLHNSESLFRSHPQVNELLEVERLEPYLKQNRGYSQLFVGKKGTGSPFHSAAIYNMFYMIDGRKKWYFVDPFDTPLIYPIYAFGSNSAISCCLYPDEFDRNEFGAFNYCPYYSTTLDAGDVLFNPPWWWHCIRNISENTVGIASRWHTGGIGGHKLMMTDENYDINRFGSFQFFSGLQGIPFLHRILQAPSPATNPHNTMREKGNRYVDMQYKLATPPGFRMFGHRFTF